MLWWSLQTLLLLRVLLRPSGSLLPDLSRCLHRDVPAKFVLTCVASLPEELVAFISVLKSGPPFPEAYPGTLALAGRVCGPSY